MTTYKIVRFHRDTDHPDHGRVLRTHQTLEQAREWCNDEATHGFDHRGDVVWFDGYTEE